MLPLEAGFSVVGTAIAVAQGAPKSAEHHLAAAAP